MPISCGLPTPCGKRSSCIGGRGRYIASFGRPSGRSPRRRARPISPGCARSRTSSRRSPAPRPMPRRSWAGQEPAAPEPQIPAGGASIRPKGCAKRPIGGMVYSKSTRLTVGSVEALRGWPGPKSLAAFSASRGGGKGRRRNIETGGMATKATEREDTEGDTEALPKSDGPLLDLTDAAVKRMIKLAKKRGYVTYDELNQVLPSEEFTSEQIEDVLGQLSELGINVVESEETEEGRAAAADGADAADDDDGDGEVAEAPAPRAVTVRETTAKEPTDRTDDPVRMYLREMGSVELLSREGEIAIAKRIEAGR